jgi:hypothetical protein
MNIGHIIYPIVVLFLVLITILNRNLLSLRILCVLLLAGFIVLGLDTVPSSNARVALDKRTTQKAEDYRDGVWAASQQIRKGNQMLMVPLAGLAIIAAFPIRRKKRSQPVEATASLRSAAPHG